MFIFSVDGEDHVQALDGLEDVEEDLIAGNVQGSVGAMKKDLAESLAGIIGVYDSEEMARRHVAKPESQNLTDIGYK